jgi:hypothetical protein
MIERMMIISDENILEENINNFEQELSFEDFCLNNL